MWICCYQVAVGGGPGSSTGLYLMFQSFPLFFIEFCNCTLGVPTTRATPRHNTASASPQYGNTCNSSTQYGQCNCTIRPHVQLLSTKQLVQIYNRATRATARHNTASAIPQYGHTCNSSAQFSQCNSKIRPHVQLLDTIRPVRLHSPATRATPLHNTASATPQYGHEPNSYPSQQYVQKVRISQYDTLISIACASIHFARILVTL
jgi:hypothetical protein